MEFVLLKQRKIKTFLPWKTVGALWGISGNRNCAFFPKFPMRKQGVAGEWAGIGFRFYIIFCVPFIAARN